MGAYSLRAYNVGQQIWGLELYSLAWGPTAWEPTVSGNGFGIWHCTHLHGGLQLGGLQSWATDLGSGIVLTRMGACSLGDYNLGQRIWDLELY